MSDGSILVKDASGNAQPVESQFIGGVYQQTIAVGDGQNAGRTARLSAGGQLAVNGGGLALAATALTTVGAGGTGTGVSSGQTVINVSEAGNLTVVVGGTLVGTLVFEAAVDLAASIWVPIQGQPSDGGNPVSTVPMTSGAAYAFDFGVTGFYWIRARLTVATSGSLTVLSGAGGLINDPIVSNIPVQATAGVGTSVAASVTSVSLLAANRARKGYVVFNDSAAVLSIGLGFTPVSTGARTYDIAPGGWMDVPVSNFAGQINGIWASAVGNARVTELT